MLGRASEIAWIELGVALADALKLQELAKKMENPFAGVGDAMQGISEERDKGKNKEALGDILKKSGYRWSALLNCMVWAQCVRESRNSIHYRTEPAMSNSYEKVAALMMGAVPHIKVLHTITATANRIALRHPKKQKRPAKR
jgi:hypothetical protein